MGQVLSAYGREGLEAIIIVTVLLAKAGSDRAARRDVLLGALSGFVLSTVLVVVANDWADKYIFARIEGYSGAIIGVVIASLVFYHAVRQHSSIKDVGFAVAFGLISIETFEIGLQTIGVDLGARLAGMAIAAAVLGLFFGVYYLVGHRPPTAKLQFLATLALSATSIWLIVKSWDELEDKSDLWFGYLCLAVSVGLIAAALFRGRKSDKHTAKL